MVKFLNRTAQVRISDLDRNCSNLRSELKKQKHDGRKISELCDELHVRNDELMRASEKYKKVIVRLKSKVMLLMREKEQLHMKIRSLDKSYPNEFYELYQRMSEMDNRPTMMEPQNMAGASAGGRLNNKEVMLTQAIRQNSVSNSSSNRSNNRKTVYRPTSRINKSIGTMMTQQSREKYQFDAANQQNDTANKFSQLAESVIDHILNETYSNYANELSDNNHTEHGEQSCEFESIVNQDVYAVESNGTVSSDQQVPERLLTISEKILAIEKYLELCKQNHLNEINLSTEDEEKFFGIEPNMIQQIVSTQELEQLKAQLRAEEQRYMSTTSVGEDLNENSLEEEESDYDRSSPENSDVPQRDESVRPTVTRNRGNMDITGGCGSGGSSGNGGTVGSGDGNNVPLIGNLIDSKINFLTSNKEFQEFCQNLYCKDTK